MSLIALTGCGSNNETGKTKKNIDSSSKYSKNKDFVIGFSNGYFGISWRTALINGMEERAAEYKKEGILSDFIVQNSNGVTEQIAAINNFINQKIDALIVDPVSASAIAPAVAKAKAAGIVVVDVSEPGNFPGVVNVIGDNVGLVKITTQWLVEKLNGKGNILYISGLPGNSADEIRNMAIKEVLENFPNIKIVGQAPGSWSETKSNAAMSTLLATYKNIDGVLAQDAMSAGILQALKSANMPLLPMTGDYSYGFLRKWKSEGLDSITTTYQPSIGRDAVGITVRLLQGSKLKKDKLTTNPLDPKSTEKDTIIVPMPYVVVNDTSKLNPVPKWIQMVNSFTKIISLDEALKKGEGQPDTAVLDGALEEYMLDSYFEDK